LFGTIIAKLIAKFNHFTCIIANASHFRGESKREIGWAVANRVYHRYLTLRANMLIGISNTTTRARICNNSARSQIGDKKRAQYVVAYCVPAARRSNRAAVYMDTGPLNVILNQYNRACIAGRAYHGSAGIHIDCDVVCRDLDCISAGAARAHHSAVAGQRDMKRGGRAATLLLIFHKKHLSRNGGVSCHKSQFSKQMR